MRDRQIKLQRRRQIPRHPLLAKQPAIYTRQSLYGAAMHTKIGGNGLQRLIGFLVALPHILGSRGGEASRALDGRFVDHLHDLSKRERH